MARSAGYVSADYLRKVAELGRRIKRRSYELMEIEQGHHLLDVGCGPGVDTVAMGRLVGAEGRVVGVDIDEEMLQQADDAACEAGVERIVQHRQADVAALPFEGGSFDGCHAERLFQVLPASYDRNAVFAEMLRVVRAGGQLVIADTDWATASVNYPDSALERRLLHFLASHMRPNGYAGRELFAMFRQHNLQNIQIEHFPMVQCDYTQSPFGGWLCGEALAAGVATQAELDEWQRILTLQHECGCFYWSVNVVLVAGEKSA